MTSSAQQQIHQKREELETGLLAGLAGLAVRSLNWDQRISEATQAANHRKLFDENPPKVEDDMNIVLGNVTTTPPQPAKGSSLLGTAAKAALAFGLLGTGVGAGVAIPLVLDIIKDFKSGTVIESGSTIIKTEQGPRYLLDLGEPVTE